MAHHPSGRDIQCDYIKTGMIIPLNGTSFSAGPLSSLTLTDTTPATTYSAASLVVPGGVGVAKNIILAGTDASTSISTGSIVTPGGLGVGGTANLGRIVCTTAATVAGQLTRYEDVFPSASTTVSANWRIDADATIIEPGVVKFSRVGSFINVCQTAACSAAMSAAANVTVINFLGAIPAGYTSATIKTGVVLGLLNGSGATFEMVANGSSLGMYLTGSNPATAGDTIRPSSFTFTYVI